jgi:hypothetical protein
MELDDSKVEWSAHRRGKLLSNSITNQLISMMLLSNNPLSVQLSAYLPYMCSRKHQPDYNQFRQ